MWIGFAGDWAMKSIVLRAALIRGPRTRKMIT